MIDLPTSPTFERLQLPHRERRERSSSEHRFVQSISAFVFPAHRRSDGVVDYILTGDETCKKQALSLLGCLARHSHGVTPSVCEAGNEIAQNLCASGEISYEVTDSDEGPVLHYVNPRSTYRIFGLYCSLLRASDEYGKPKFGPLVAHGTRFWLIKIPPQLGGTRQHKRLLRSIGGIGDFMPMFRIKMLHENKYDPFDKRFDHEFYSRAYAEFITSATSKWGWSADSRYTQYSTEYFGLKRWISSVKAKTILRNHIVACMNRLFLNIGLSARIGMKSGRTVQDCDTKLEELESGEITTGDLLDWLSARDIY